MRYTTIIGILLFKQTVIRSDKKSGIIYLDATIFFSRNGMYDDRSIFVELIIGSEILGGNFVAIFFPCMFDLKQFVKY